MIDTNTVHWPTDFWEEQRGSDLAQGASTRRWELTALDTYKRGDWTGGGTKNLRARLALYDGTTTIGGRVRLSQNSAGVDIVYNDYGSVANANFTGAQDIKQFELETAGSVEATTTWDTVIEGSNSVNETLGPQNCGGVLYYDPNATTGLIYSQIASGGWDHHDHRSGAVGDPSYIAGGGYSDTAILNWCKFMKSPDTVIIHVVNAASDETGSGSTLRAQFKANLTFIIDRWRTQMLAAATANGDTIEPLFLLLSPWTTIDTTTRAKRDELHNAALELQDELGDVCTIYMNEIMDRKYGDWTDWSADFLDGSLIHQNAAGLQPFGETLFQALEGAYQQADNTLLIDVELVRIGDVLKRGERRFKSTTFTNNTGERQTFPVGTLINASGQPIDDNGQETSVTGIVMERVPDIADAESRTVAVMNFGPGMIDLENLRYGQMSEATLKTRLNALGFEIAVQSNERASV